MAIKESVETLVFAGTRTGVLYIFRLAVVLENGHEIKGSLWTIGGMHHYAVTSVCISENNQHLFSGDENGAVVCTDMLFSLNETESSIITREGEEIIQLDYLKSLKLLLVSTKRRNFLVRTDNGDEIMQIGSKERKIQLDFGACFSYNINDPRNPKIFSSRPGMRIWKSNINGKVEQTILFKDAIKESKYQKIPLIHKLKSRNNNEIIQFGRVLKFLENYILTWTNSHFFVLSTDGVVVSSLENITIRDICINESEIFILQELDNIDIIRLSLMPDERFSIRLKGKFQGTEQTVYNKILKNLSRIGDRMAFSVPEGTKLKSEDKSPSDPPSESNSACDLINDTQMVASKEGQKKPDEETLKENEAKSIELTETIKPDLQPEPITLNDDKPDLDSIGKKCFDDTIVFSIKTAKVKKKRKKIKKRVDEDSRSFLSSNSGSGSNDMSVADSQSLSSLNSKSIENINNVVPTLTDVTSNKINVNVSDSKEEKLINEEPQDNENIDNSNSSQENFNNLEKDERKSDELKEEVSDSVVSNEIKIIEQNSSEQKEIEEPNKLEERLEESTEEKHVENLSRNEEECTEIVEEDEEKGEEILKNSNNDDQRQFSLPCEIFNSDDASLQPSLSSSTSMSDEEFNSIYTRDSQTNEIEVEETISNQDINEEEQEEKEDDLNLESLTEEIWTEMSTPSIIQSFCVTDKFIWLVDKSQKLHYCDLTVREIQYFDNLQ